MEASDAAASMDFLVRSLLVLGATTQEVARVIARRSAGPAAQPPWTRGLLVSGPITSSRAP